MNDYCMLILKMLGLYLDTLTSGHTIRSMLSILNEFTFQMKLQSFLTNNVIWTKHNRTTNNNNANLKYVAKSEASNRGPYAPQSHALPLER